MRLPRYASRTQALDFIRSHHNRTAASPENGIYIGEYGVPQETTPLSELVNVTTNVLAYGLDRGASHIMFWELFNNEVDASFSPSLRCDGGKPDFNATDQRGFWLVQPNGTRSWAWGYMNALLTGAVPVPTPPPSGGRGRAGK